MGFSDESVTDMFTGTSSHVKYHLMEGPVREEDVGITEFISPHQGFSAVIKQRQIYFEFKIVINM